MTTDAPRCPACRAAQALPQRKGGRYDFRCVRCCARLIVHARPSKPHQDGHLAAIARLDGAPTRQEILAAVTKTTT